MSETTKVWFVMREGKSLGPFTQQELSEALDQSRFAADALVSEGTSGQWRSLNQVVDEYQKVVEANFAQNELYIDDEVAIATLSNEGMLEVLAGGQWVGPLTRIQIRQLLHAESLAGNELVKDAAGKIDSLSRLFPNRRMLAVRPEIEVTNWRYSILNAAIFLLYSLAALLLVVFVALLVMFLVRPQRGMVEIAFMCLGGVITSIIQAEMIRLAVDVALSLQSQTRLLDWLARRWR